MFFEFFGVYLEGDAVGSTKSCARVCCVAGWSGRVAGAATLAEWLWQSGRVAEWLSGCVSHSGRAAEWLNGCGRVINQ